MLGWIKNNQAVQHPGQLNKVIHAAAHIKLTREMFRKPGPARHTHHQGKWHALSRIRLANLTLLQGSNANAQDNQLIASTRLTVNQPS